MRLNNSTDIPDQLIRQVIRSVKPFGLSNFDVTVTNCKHLFQGRAYSMGSGYHGSADPFIIARVGGSWKFPVATTGVKGKGYIAGIQLYNRIEVLTYLIAHELRHLWQAKTRKGSYVWGSKGRFSERDCDAYALKMLRKWRKTNPIKLDTLNRYNHALHNHHTLQRKYEKELTNA